METIGSLAKNMALVVRCPEINNYPRWNRPADASVNFKVGN